jgi:hypothetical protein
VFTKIKDYQIEAKNLYNMDEKGMMIGKIKAHKRIFTSASVKNGKILGACEDGNRDWITLLSTICADGSWHRPLLIYPAQSHDVHDSWVHVVNWETDDVSFTASDTGWTNNKIGIEWLKHFIEITKAKMTKTTDYRMLVLDGHGSHLTTKFFELCHKNRIILAVFPPYSTYRLQPLDIGMFRLFAIAYSDRLIQWMADRLGINQYTKRHFFEVFWPAHLQSFTSSNILSAWSKSGIWPMDASKITKIFKPPQDRPSTATSDLSTMSIHAYRRVKAELRTAMSGMDNGLSILIGDWLEKYQTALSIAEHERDCYARAALTEIDRRKRSKPLALNTFKKEHGNIIV